MEVAFNDTAGTYQRDGKKYYIRHEIFSKSIDGFWKSGLFLRGKAKKQGGVYSLVFYVNDETLEDLFYLDVMDHSSIMEFAKVNDMLFITAARKHVNIAGIEADHVCNHMNQQMPLYDMSETIRAIFDR